MVLSDSATSDDAHYNNLAVPSVKLLVLDPFRKNVSFDTKPLTVAEGSSTTYELRIQPAATSDVTVAIVSASSLVIVNPSSVTFTVGGPTAVTINVSRAEDLIDIDDLTADVIVHR